MELKVRLIDDNEPKSVQEIERELVEKHEQQLQESSQDTSDTLGNSTSNSTEVNTEEELSEEKVLSYISSRYNRPINSFDELMSERSSQDDIPEDIAAYLKYRKETGRGYDDYLKLGRDYESMNQEQLLKEYLLATQEGLDEEDVELMMDDYRYDEDIDDDSKIKKTKIATKKAIAEAKKFFNTQKEMYKKPLESSAANISKEEREEIEEYKQYLQQAKTIQEQDERKRNWFAQKTNEVFNNEFKGFEFSVNDKKFTFAPGDAVELKKNQSTPSNFINKFLDENGLMKDAAGYHRSLAIAMNPERFAKFFYEQGLADATDDVMRKTKNINMSERRAPEVTSKGGVKVRAVNPDSGRSLKIRSNKQ